QVLGPSLRLGWSGNYMQSHLNFHSRLGHYLLQPILMNMQNYDSPKQAFKAWNGAINTRDKSMQRIRRDCPWQEEVSRLEFLQKHPG
ncbi:MAG: DUF3457 domain-containing protein, partial [gamma proteobacterium symbiont of Ctena orbiculata]